jgi:hypothetical protein
LRRLGQFNVLSKNSDDLQVFSDWSSGSRPQPGQCVVLVQKFDYDYYIPAGKLPPRGRSPYSKPYARSLVIMPQFDFTIPGEVPSQFSEQPLIFIGLVADAQAEIAQQPARLQVDGIAIVPFNQNRAPDFARVLCSPTSVLNQIGGAH